MHTVRTALLSLPLLVAACPAEDRDGTQDETDSDDTDVVLFVSTGDALAAGPLEVAPRVVVEADEAQGLPVPVTITAPAAPGSYAVVLFLHGFQLGPSYYEGLHDALASHGFVVVAPQMPGTLLEPITTAVEAEHAAAVIDWMAGHLDEASGVDARDDVLGLAGHSRGGKAAWRLLDADPDAALALFGIDPVDTEGMGTDPRVIDGPFTFAVPTLVEGAGLGPDGGTFGQACAPAGDNHEQFYEASPSPSVHVVVPGYGHMDMVDEDCGLLCNVCTGAEDPTPMRTLTAGLLVGFFREHLQQNETSLYDLLSSPPLELQLESK